MTSFSSQQHLSIVPPSSLHHGTEPVLRTEPVVVVMVCDEPVCVVGLVVFLKCVGVNMLIFHV